ncbi:MAG TPA: TolC family protein [Gemmatimonadaceae bacterium]|nr:TolC family protein [Gemmatimonadaceae bacterium]
MNTALGFRLLAIGYRLSAIGTLLAASQAGAQQITLKEAVERAQKQSFAAASATATRDAARARDNAFSARRLPQLSLTGTAPRFEKTITPVIQPDGSTNFTPVQATTADAGLTLAQQLPFSGGTFSITSQLQRYEVTGGTNNTLRWTSSPVIFSVQQPLLRPNTMKWDGREADIRLDASERQYLEAREGVALQATEAFFELYLATRTLENAITNAATNDTLYNLNKGRLEIGKIGENDLLQSELALLRSRATLDNARLEYQRRLAAFRLAVDLPPGAPVEIVIPDGVPVINADTAVAVTQALRNRAQISELELQTVQAQRQLSVARLQGGPGATINASVGFNQTAPDMSLAYRDLLQAQRFSMFVSVPVFNWGARSGDIQEAKANQKRVEATVRQSREQLIQDAHFAALQLAQARRNLDVSAKADTVAAKRFEVAYNRYVIGRIGIDNLYIAQNEKDQAVTQYLQALRNYWMAYYRLRQTTLYDFEAGVAIR